MRDTSLLLTYISDIYDVTHSCTAAKSVVTRAQGKKRFHLCDTTHVIHTTLLVHTCDMTNACVCHDPVK